MTWPIPRRGASATLLAAALLAGCAAPGGAGSGSDGAATGSVAGVSDAASRGAGAGAGPGAGTAQAAPSDSGFAPAPTRAPVWGPVEPAPSGTGALPTAADARDVSASRPFTPLSLTLPSGKQVPVHRAEVAADGSLVVPTIPQQVGWWTGGARPGDRYGSVVLAGHIDSMAYGIGALAELVGARPGQQVTLRAGTSALTYRIGSTRRVPKAALASGTDTFRQDLPARLVLVTCGGAYDSATHTYADNLIVVATPG